MRAPWKAARARRADDGRRGCAVRRSRSPGRRAARCRTAARPRGDAARIAASSTTRSARPMRPALPSRPRASARARVYETRNDATSATNTGDDRPGVAVAREHERDRAQHGALGDAIGGRVDEGAEDRGLAAGARERAVQDVDDRADQEDGGRRDVVLAVDQHGGDEVEGEAERGQLVGRDAALTEHAHGARGELARAVGVAGLDPVQAHGQACSSSGRWQAGARARGARRRRAVGSRR